MPYITGSQRYGSPRPATVTNKFANLAKNMGRYQGPSTASSVNRKRTAEEALESTSYGHPLPQRPQQPASYDHGFRSGRFGGEAGWNPAGCGGHSGDQQHYGQQGYQRALYGQREYQGQLYGKAHWQQQGWQGGRYQHPSQRYHGTGPQYPWQEQGTFNQGRSPISWQRSTTQYPALPSTTPADQAWQAEYFRQYQQYASSPQYLLSQQFAQQIQETSQYELTQQWRTANSADTSSSAELNANATVFAPQVPPLKLVPAAELNRRYRVDKDARYAGRKLNTTYPKFTPANGDLSVQQTTKQRWNGAPRFGTTAQRNGPAANTRSFTTATKEPEAKVKNPRKNLLMRPSPTVEYLAQANKDPETLSSPRPLFVILDLNGTLLYRKQRGGSSFMARPYVSQFLRYLLKNHHVMVWSSARPYNVEPMCKQLFFQEEMDQLVAVWSRDDLRLPKHAYREKVQVYKQLSWVWNDSNIRAKSSTPWGQADTVLIDDSIEKAASEPHNIIEIEEFEGKDEQIEVDVLGQVVKYLEALRWEKDVSAYMRSKPFVFDAGMSFDWTLVVEDKSSLMV